MLELLKSRRSVRRYTEQEVEREKLNIILKSALVSPTSRNKRSWEFIVVKDKQALSALSVCKAGASFIADAALAIAVIGDQELSDVWIEDASIASANIMNTAHSQGLGSCWVQFRNRFNGDMSAEEEARKILGIPDQYGVECVIAVGYPQAAQSAYDEALLPYDKLHEGRYGTKYSL